MKPQTDSTEVIFREEQRFRQPWLWVLVMGMSAAIVVVIAVFGIRQAMGRPIGGEPLPLAAYLALGGVLLADVVFLPLMLLKLVLITEVDGQGLSVRFWPLPVKRIPFETIAEAEYRRYSPMREYGGWGIRWGRSGKAYNVSGDEGVQLVLTDGKRVLIGSQRAYELAEAITSRRL